MQIPDGIQWVCAAWGAVLGLGALDHLVRAARTRPGRNRADRAAEAFDWAASAACALGAAAENPAALLTGLLAYTATAVRRRLRRPGPPAFPA
ncbi:hypothetical protein LG634_20395 [Streptomyces bambusae]|uniref:hypothetical protein n=1 Tax=Streptomyces bambusae TaxID=1550616 RepID=UPI001CFC537A|nr:hypothetical protein [Streptomyces bambusae]MCB5167191.1 hypothetical protein [Streptomyces bambusae]